MRRLLIRPGAIGDCILALPELESVRAEYTEVWTPRAILPLIQFADRTRAIADTGLDLIGVRDNASLQEFESFDSIYSWYGSNFDPFRDAVRHLPFTFFPALPINVIGTPRIRVPDLPRENLAILHPFSGSAKKNWPLEHFQEVASRLDQPVTFCAGPGATHVENLYDLACWLSTASVYVGNDSGISHPPLQRRVPRRRHLPRHRSANLAAPRRACYRPRTSHGRPGPRGGQSDPQIATW